MVFKKFSFLWKVEEDSLLVSLAVWIGIKLALGLWREGLSVFIGEAG